MDTQKKYWNEFIIDWDKSVYERSRENMSFVEKIATSFRSLLIFRTEYAVEQITPHIKDKNIIEIGCGTGRYSLELLQKGAMHITGYDISDLAINKANKMFSDFGVDKNTYTFKSIDLKDFKAPEVKDNLIVTGLGILQYLSDEEKKAFFKKVDGAQLFFEFHEDKFSFLEVCHTIYRKLKPSLPFYHKPTKKELRKLISQETYPKLYYSRVRGVSYFSSIPIEGWSSF